MSLIGVTNYVYLFCCFIAVTRLLDEKLYREHYNFLRSVNEMTCLQ